MPKPMKLRNVRMSDELWIELRKLAASRDQTVGEMVREHLAALVRRNRKVIDSQPDPDHAPSPTDS